MTCGGNVMYFGAKGVKGVTQAQIRTLCKESGQVYDKKSKTCRASKRVAAKPKASKPKSLRVRTSDAASMKQIRRACNKEGLVYDTKLKMCRPSKVGPAKPKTYKPKAFGPAKKPSKSAMVMKAKKAVCRADGMVYDAKAKKCRETRRRRALAAFGLMHSTPARWPQGIAYYQAPKFSKPDLLLGKAFETVANKAATQAATQVATKAASKAISKAMVKTMS